MISPPHRLLIVKPSSLGDVVHALPALAALRRSWPETLIDWLVKKEWEGLLRHHPMLRDVLLLPDEVAQWCRLIRTLGERRYDMVIDLQGLLRSGLISLMTKATVRVGFANGREGSSWCYNRLLPSPKVAIHAVDRYLDVARQLGAEGVGPVTFPLPSSVEAAAWVDALWREKGIGNHEKVCLIHPAARWDTKRWSAEKYAQVADWLVIDKSVRVFLIAGRDQSHQVKEVARHMRSEVTNLAGQTTLAQLAALLRKASCLITNDSGPMHLSAAVGTPVIAIFGPTDPRKVGPYGQGHRVVRKDFDCFGCNRRRCVHGMACLNNVGIDDVIRAVAERLGETPTNEARQTAC